MVTLDLDPADTVCNCNCRISGGELFERIIDEDFELTEREVIKYMLQIIDGVNFIHKQGIVHLDLKPENIMCVNKTGSKIKLIDFGLARRLGISGSTVGWVDLLLFNSF